VLKKIINGGVEEETPVVLSKFTSTNQSFEEFNKLTNTIENEKGNYSLYIKNLKTNKTYTYNSNNIYYAASLYKLPVGVAVLKQIQEGKISFTTSLPYLPKHYTDGTGYINQSNYGTMYTVDQLLTALYKDSDNVAQEMLLDLIDVDSKNVSNAFPKQGVSDYYHVNKSSSLEIGEYIEYIFNSDYLTLENKQYLLEIMNNTSFDYLFANNLPIPFSHKIGLYGGTIHDCGITKDSSIIICIMSENTDIDTFIKVGNSISSFVVSL